MKSNKMTKRKCKIQDSQRIIEILKQVGAKYCPEFIDRELDVTMCEIFFDDPDGLMLTHGLDFISPQGKVHGNIPKYRKLRNIVIEQVQNELKDRIETLEKFKIKTFPRKWMVADKQIKTNMEKVGNRHLYPIYEYMTDYKMTFAESTEFIKKHELQKKLKVKHPVLCCIDRDHICEKLGITREILYKYLEAMRVFEIISSVGRHGKNAKQVYVLGRWSHVKNKNPRPIYDLKINPKMKQALRCFSVSWGKAK